MQWYNCELEIVIYINYSHYDWLIENFYELLCLLIIEQIGRWKKKLN